MYVNCEWICQTFTKDRVFIFSLHIVLTYLSTIIVPSVRKILGTLLKCQENELFPLPLHLFFLKKGRESGFYLFILCKHMTCAWEDDTWGTRFFKHTVELLGESAIQVFYPWQEYNFPFSGKEVWNFVFKGRKVHNKIKKSFWMSKSS